MDLSRVEKQRIIEQILIAESLLNQDAEMTINQKLREDWRAIVDYVLDCENLWDDCPDLYIDLVYEWLKAEIL